MKRFFILFTLVAFVATISFAQEKTKAESHAGHNHEMKSVDHSLSSDNVTDAAGTTSGAKMTFQSKEVNYGTIPQNADGVRTFPFINDGTEPLIIKQAKGSCGCTVPSYPKEPIMPGAKSEISVKYDTKRVGPFSKSVRIVTNMGPDPIVLTIKGVVEKEAEGLPEKEGNGLGSF